MSILSDNLKKARHHLAFTQQKAAREIGVKRPLLGAWEEGRAKPSILLLPIICQVYCIVDWRGFLTKEQWDPARQNPSASSLPEFSSIEKRYRKLRGVPRQLADILLKEN